LILNAGIKKGQGHTLMGIVRRFALQAIACLLALFVAVPAAAADTTALKGKSIRVVIGSTPGNVGDAIARLYFKAMADALPDSTVRVQNLGGAGGVRAIKEVQEANGSAVTLGWSGNGPLYQHMLTPGAAAFGRLNVRWVGSVMSGQRVLVVRSGLGIRTLDQLRARRGQLTFGGSEQQDALTIEAYILNAALDLGVKIVPGLELSQIAALMLAGDVDVAIVGTTGMNDYLRTGSMVPLMKYVDEQGLDFLKGVPKLADLDEDPGAREVTQMIRTLIRTRSFVFAAPGTDNATVDALRAVFDGVTADPAFRTQAEKFDVSEPTPGMALDAALNGANGEVGGRLESVGAAARFYVECGKRMSDAGARSCPR
jgi:tripartite-type tricarboxylate transporter receptor subunit TctC